MNQAASGENWLIKAERLSKTYLHFNNSRDRLKHYIFGTKYVANEIRALDDISFSVSTGEVVGVIGNNGAGKSTLLQLVCGTVNPSAGRIRTRGRIAALLELGAGFNPEFTGRENIRLNASLLGLSQHEIDAAMDSIIDFADIQKAIDYAVKTYSTGMSMRLAFSIATSVKPDLLIIDEALSVGDGAFARKSFERILALRDSGCAILFCSHSLYHVESIADRVIWLENGRLRMLGPAASTTRQYAIESLNLDQTSDVPQVDSHVQLETSDVPARSVLQNKAANYDAEALAGQAKLIEINGFLASEKPGDPKTEIPGRNNRISLRSSMFHNAEQESSEDELLMLRTLRDELVIQVRFAWDRELTTPSIAFSIEELERGIVITSGSSQYDRHGVNFSVDESQRESRYLEKTVKLHFPSIPLLHGSYAVNIFLACERALHLYDYRSQAVRFRVTQDGLEQGFFSIARRWDDGTTISSIQTV